MEYELGPCVKYNGKTWCFDAVSGKYVDIYVTMHDLGDCPECVVGDISLLMMGKKPRFCEKEENNE